MNRMLEYDSVVGYKFQKEIKIRIPHESGGYLIETNAQGFRSNHDFFKKQEKNKFRILVFGDSYTAGDGVSNGCRYTDFIENYVQNVEVFNFGLPGTGTDQHYLCYKELPQGYESDLLILAVQVENIKRVVMRSWPWFVDQEISYISKPYYKIKNNNLILFNNPVPKKLIPKNNLNDPKTSRFKKFKSLVNKFYFVKNFKSKFYLSKLLPEYRNSKSEGWKIMSMIIKKWVKEYAKPFILMPIPLCYFIEDNANPIFYQKRFTELCKATGCILHDPLPFLKSFPMNERKEFHFMQDIHPTTKFHLALADSLIPVIQYMITDKYYNKL